MIPSELLSSASQALRQETRLGALERDGLASQRAISLRSKPFEPTLSNVQEHGPAESPSGSTGPMFQAIEEFSNEILPLKNMSWISDIVQDLVGISVAESVAKDVELVAPTEVPEMEATLSMFLNSVRQHVLNSPTNSDSGSRFLGRWGDLSHTQNQTSNNLSAMTTSVKQPPSQLEWRPARTPIQQLEPPTSTSSSEQKHSVRFMGVTAVYDRPRSVEGFLEPSSINEVGPEHRILMPMEILYEDSTSASGAISVSNSSTSRMVDTNLVSDTVPSFETIVSSEPIDGEDVDSDSAEISLVQLMRRAFESGDFTAVHEFTQGYEVEYTQSGSISSIRRKLEEVAVEVESTSDNIQISAAMTVDVMESLDIETNPNEYVSDFGFDSEPSMAPSWTPDSLGSDGNDGKLGYEKGATGDWRGFLRAFDDDDGDIDSDTTSKKTERFFNSAGPRPNTRGKKRSGRSMSMPFVSTIRPPPERVVFESDTETQDAEFMQNEVSMSVTLTAQRLNRRHSVDMLSEGAISSIRSIRSHLTPNRRGLSDSKTASAQQVQSTPKSTRSSKTVREWTPPLQQYQLVKHGRWGRPKLKMVNVDRTDGIISWGTGFVRVEDIVQVRKGRQTKVLQRKYAKNEDEGRFMSIVCARRTVDWELHSRSERNRLILIVQSEVSTYMERERGMKLHWSRHNTQNDFDRVSDLHLPKKSGLKRLFSCVS